ncbi:hypothetical protein EMB92_04045 [Bifidobacterium callitrichos]|uniref:Transmembrane protein n=1 Tax=Bifidobacterium callitrichos TaxID=762209 RepID=A0A5M9ZGX1_9BIFI|nr:hypothetical protein [Bifidobacterium callitrichos]KAA8817712.1 hypothetical protein EMB92_04045 [Bifidobacterium callitrichos]
MKPIGQVEPSKRRTVVISGAESVVCFLGWVVVFALGSDRPVPPGFWKLVVLVGVLLVVQFLYVRRLLADMLLAQPTFRRNEVMFAVAGVSLAVLTGWWWHTDFTGMAGVIWLVVVAVVGLVYGTVLWTVNRTFVRVFCGRIRANVR